MCSVAYAARRAPRPRPRPRPLAANVFACSSKATECRAPIFETSSLLAWEILLEGNLFRLSDSVMADCTSNYRTFSSRYLKNRWAVFVVIRRGDTYMPSRDLKRFWSRFSYFYSSSGHFGKKRLSIRPENGFRARTCHSFHAGSPNSRHRCTTWWPRTSLMMSDLDLLSKVTDPKHCSTLCTAYHLQYLINLLQTWYAGHLG